MTRPLTPSAGRLARFLLLGLWVVLLGACGVPEAPVRRLPELAVHRQLLRPTNSAAMWHFDAAEVVESFPSAGGGFRVHFTRAGRNAVLAGDSNANGIPDFVEQVAQVYETVATFYAGTLGFRPPLSDASVPGDHGGDGRFDIYLVDFAHSSDGAFQVDTCPGPNPDTCIGYVVQENDFAGYGYPNATVATRILGSHEYFHAVQAAYDHGQGVVPEEGTAVWASEAFDPSLHDFESFVGGYLSKPERSLDIPPPGPVPSFAYGSAIFFQFLNEKYERPLVRKLWERCENGQGLSGPGIDPANPYWLTQLDLILKAEYASSFAGAFQQFAIWNLYTAGMANPSKGYAQGDDYPEPLILAVPAPYQEPKLRSYYASAQYYRVALGGRSTLAAALVDPSGAIPGELGGVSLVLAVRRGATWSEMKVLPAPAAGVLSADTAGANDAVVAVVNENLSGSSKRPGLCVGTPGEVASCQTALSALDGGVDGGVDGGEVGAPDAGPEADAGDSGGGGPGEVPPGCGCGAAPSGMALLFVIGLALSRRRIAPVGSDRAPPAA